MKIDTAKLNQLRTAITKSMVAVQRDFRSIGLTAEIESNLNNYMMKYIMYVLDLDADKNMRGEQIENVMQVLHHMKTEYQNNRISGWNSTKPAIPVDPAKAAPAAVNVANLNTQTTDFYFTSITPV
ncbi:MAG: hypothetical protein DI527_24565 [Chelatococcus sp.]|nr:MAG: hypothetical protein DI527_24565 [Chelatococcus sp.]